MQIIQNNFVTYGLAALFFSFMSQVTLGAAFSGNYIFLLFAYLGIYSIIYYSGENIYSYSLSLLLLVTFSTGYFIFQKYFEPMFFILLFTFYDKKRIKKTINRSINWIAFYFTSYYLALNIIY